MKPPTQLVFNRIPSERDERLRNEILVVGNEAPTHVMLARATRTNYPTIARKIGMIGTSMAVSDEIARSGS